MIYAAKCQSCEGVGPWLGRSFSLKDLDLIKRRYGSDLIPNDTKARSFSVPLTVFELEPNNFDETT